MADSRHVEILGESVDTWNRWRSANPSITPDLSQANFSNLNLAGANFHRANLKKTNFRKVCLEKAIFSYANLIHADLREAILSKANFRMSELIKADLSQADLKKTILLKADLTKANLSEANLSEANLSEANLRGANLKEANLRKAYLEKANFSYAKLLYADLREATLTKANFRMSELIRANLSQAILNEANLWNADLSDAKLRRADLHKANLDFAKFWGADLGKANFTQANLKAAQLWRANLRGAKLLHVNLNGLNFDGVDLSNANLCEADLSDANLSRVHALSTNFTGAKLTGACIEDWHINSDTSLGNVICDYIYLKKNKQERRPSSRYFEAGEFTTLFQKALETVDLIFVDGIDWKAFLMSFQELIAKYGEDNISVQAIEKKSGAFVIRLEVPPEANKAEIEYQAKQLYQERLNALEAQYHIELKAKDEVIEIYRQFKADFYNIIQILANKPMSEIFHTNIQGATIGSFASQLNDNASQQANQYNIGEKQDLAIAASEIQQLLRQLKLDNPASTDTEVAVKAADAINNNPTLKARVIGALSSGGKEAFKAAVDNPIINVLLAIIDGWREG